MKKKITLWSCIVATALACGTIAPSWTANMVKAESGDSIVNPYQVYSYEKMYKDIKALASKYPDLVRYKTIGKSEYGRDLVAVELGKGPAGILINGAHHAREWISTILIMSMIDRYAQAHAADASIGNMAVRRILEQTTIRFVPMVNPDGVTLQQTGLRAFPKADWPALIKMNQGSTNFKRWKANGKGVDLNRQYPAKWEGISNPASGPNYMNYKGKQPAQAKETMALIHYTKQVQPEIAVAYHSSGEILFWHFHTDKNNLARDRKIASTVSNMTGYSLVAPKANPSGGGYTDWFIQQFGRPGLTPELGNNAGPTNVPLAEFDSIWGQNRSVGLYLATEGYELWQARQERVPVRAEMRIFQKTKLYEEPSVKSRVAGTIEAGPVAVVKKKGDMVAVESPYGIKWMPASLAAEGKAEESANAVIVAENTPLYDSPLSSKPLPSTIGPQQLMPLEKWNGWYRIETWLGDKWIKAEYTTAVEREEPPSESTEGDSQEATKELPEQREGETGQGTETNNQQDDAQQQAQQSAQQNAQQKTQQPSQQKPAAQTPQDAAKETAGSSELTKGANDQHE